MLILIVFYQIVVVLISTIILIRNLSFSFSNHSLEGGEIFLALLWVVFLFFFLYTNIILLIKKHKQFNLCLKFNAWVNFIQIFQLTALGVTFSLVMGAELTPYVFYSSDAFYLGLHRDIFNIKLNMRFSSSSAFEIVSFGLNILPLLASIYLFRIVNSSNK